MHGKRTLHSYTGDVEPSKNAVWTSLTNNLANADADGYKEGEQTFADTICGKIKTFIQYNIPYRISDISLGYISGETYL